MPKATASIDTIRHDLKSLPGAFVVLRRMTYGQTLARKDMVRLSLDMGKGKDLTGVMAMANATVSLMEFKWCIVEHNLEKDDDGNLLNLSNKTDFDMLDPKVGQEIDKLINEMNNFEDDDEAKN